MTKHRCRRSRRRRSSASATVHVVCNNAGVVSQADAWFGPLSAWDVGARREPLGRDPRRARVPAAARRAGRGSHREHREHRRPAARASAPRTTRPSTRSSRSPKTCTSRCSESGLPIGVSVLCPGWVRTNILDAERNWPEELGDRAAARARLRHRARSRAAGDRRGHAAGRVADLVADAVQSDRFWVLPHPGVRRGRGAPLARHRRRRQSPTRRGGARAPVDDWRSPRRSSRRWPRRRAPEDPMTRGWSFAVGRDDLSRTGAVRRDAAGCRRRGRRCSASTASG